MASESIQVVLRQIENTVTDLRHADSSSFDRYISKLSRLLHSPRLDELTERLSAGVDLDAWLGAARAAHSGGLGSVKLDWPSDQEEELGHVVALVDRSADEPNFALNFAFDFCSAEGGNVSRALQGMVNQILVPFSRDYIDYIKRETGEEEAGIMPIKSEPAARKVFVVHGRDDGAKEGVARFLERLGFEAIILHEQASQGRTIIEKVEAHGEVGFAVILLTPDDEGNAVGEAVQPRARQNVVLELGYFLGRLGRSRVMAFLRGSVEIPSDFHGVVYASFSGDWKHALARELQAAGFDIDWNVVMM